MATMTANSNSRNAEAFAFTTAPMRFSSVTSLSNVYKKRMQQHHRVSRTMVAAPEAQASTTKQEIVASTLPQEEMIPATMSDALHRFFLGPDRGPICVVGMLSFLFAWRCSLAEVTLLDLVSVVATALFWCFQEHFIHDKLLHSKGDWMGKEIHENHHAKPYFNISIDPAGLIIGWLVSAHMLLRAVLPLPLALSATLGYSCAGLLYEWAHYIVHTRVKPPNAFWKKIRDNHARHHLVDSRYWLSFTLVVVDDIFGTNPSVDDIKRQQKQH